ncbi:MAG: ABC transporter permease [bacterium]|nr:ABC transporter permease [bacterium]
MRAVLVVAGQELRDGLRDRWVLAATALMAALALSLVLLGSAPAGTVSSPSLTVAVVSLSSLSIFLVPLIALLVSYDAIVGESERGTLLLLLSYPIARWQMLVGKFLGHTAILAVATTVGYGAAGVLVLLTTSGNDAASWHAFAALIGSSVLLGAVFIALGYLVSGLSRERGTAAGLAVGVWVVFVILFDTALLGILVAVDIPSSVVSVLLLLNPTDAYRLLNLAGFEEVRFLSGMAQLSTTAGFGLTVVAAGLVAWLVVPLSVAAFLFQRREL